MTPILRTVRLFSYTSGFYVQAQQNKMIFNWSAAERDRANKIEVNNHILSGLWSENYFVMIFFSFQLLNITRTRHFMCCLSTAIVEQSTCHLRPFSIA